MRKNECNYKEGEVFYRYTINKGKLYANRGTVVDYSWSMYIIKFDDGQTCSQGPAKDGFNVVSSTGSLWLKERDDKLALKIFIDHKERKLAELQQKVKQQIKLINSLKEEA